MIELGLAPEHFREAYCEKQPRVQKAAVDRESFAWSDLDAVLRQVEPTAPALQLVNGGPVPEEHYTDRFVELGAPRIKLNKRRFCEQLRNGATLIVNRFERYSARAMHLCRQVGRFAGCETTGNAYLSLGGPGTFGKHWDTHDVFAIQLIGRKRWQIYPPTFPLPLGAHRSDVSGHVCPPTPTLDCVLEAGDVLYVPRGWWHQALPFAEPSLHLSIGTYGPTVHDYLLWACSRYLPEVVGARRSLTDAVDAAEIDAVLQVFSAIVLADETRAEFELDVAARERIASDFDTELFLAAGPDALESGATLSLTIRRPLPAESSELVVNGARLRLHPLSRSIVAALAESALTVEALHACLPDQRPGAIRAAVLELALHEIVTIERVPRRRGAIEVR